VGGHPLQDGLVGPVSAQSQLKKPVAAQRAGLDQPSHWGAVSDKGTQVNVTGIGVCVEMDHRYLAEAVPAGHSGVVRPGDGVVTAEDDRDGTRGRDLEHGRLDQLHGLLDVPVVELDVAGVIHPKLLEAVDAQRQAGTGAILWEVAGLAQGRWTEPVPER
jgi:hypothetical protein